MEIRINTLMRHAKHHKDSKRREEHILDRMVGRGIGVEQIRQAVQKGSKKIRQDHSIIAEYSWFKVVYREFRIDGVRKIYPITVMEL